MKKAVKILGIVALVLSILGTITGTFGQLPVIGWLFGIYSLIVGIISIIKCAKKKPSIVLGVFACLSFPHLFACGVLMIVISILNKKIAAKEAAEEVVEEEYAEEEYVEYAE